MNILGIETSCDETAASVVKDGRQILSNIVATSAQMHAETGGVIPENAARQQIKSIIPVIDRAVKDVFGKRLAKDSIDAIAVTFGPGLIGSLLVGVESAKTLSYIWKKPLIPVNHLVGHIYTNWLDNPTPPEFPALSLLVSGGHTDLVLLKNHKDMSWLGGTRDDAAGEAFDKCARLLGLSYPGGPSIAREADIFTNQKTKIKLPRPMIGEEGFEWSFSGLKTAVLKEVQRANVQKNKSLIPEFAYEIQEAICEVLIAKAIKAVKQYKPKSFLLAGGVAANKRLKQMFEDIIQKEKLKVDFRVPNPKLCTDNAAYIASCAFFHSKKIVPNKLRAVPDLTII